ncbi:hypothetical protein ACFWIA_09400 [Streptomyces sp. NPDC127068]|uniref:hypothetical protein n=1 Tax=Streptomyces sp. NPDC127068 TaxID=3347127 RepID=UPI003653A615
MLALRLARGASPSVQARRLLVTAASTGTALLLLCTFGYALGHPWAAVGSSLRLAWCAAPLAATAYLALAVARTDPATRPRRGLSAVGLGPARRAVFAAVSTAGASTVGALAALLLFLYLRGDLGFLPFAGGASELLAADRELPLAAILTLLALVPVTASATAVLSLRPRTPVEPGAGAGGGRPVVRDPDDPVDDADLPPAAPATPAGLPWGIALLAAGLAVESYAGGSGPAPGLRLPGGLAGGSLSVLVGWALTAVGLALAGPGMTYLCGRAVQAVRPGAVRLLAGRVLQREAHRIGRPLGVVCAVAAGAYAAATLYTGSEPDTGPLSVLGAGLVVGCAVAALALATVEARQARSRTTAALLRQGAPAAALRAAALLRVAALCLLFGPLTWAVAALAAAPLDR